jgi:hypothetical protein
MRLIRRLTAGLAILPLVATAGHAQSGRLFDNSWFWGLSGGSLTYWTSATAHESAPLLGIDWMFTRKHFGLLVDFDQAFFTASNISYTNVGRFYTDTTFTTSRDYAYGAVARVRNSRHLQAAFVAFPTSGHIKPYVGLGISGNFVQGLITTSAAPGPPSAVSNPNQWQPDFYGEQYRAEAADWVTPVILVGLQAQLSRFSIFGEAKVFPNDATPEFPHLFTDQAFYILRAGIRVNALAAIGNW